MTVYRPPNQTTSSTYYPTHSTYESLPRMGPHSLPYSTGGTSVYSRVSRTFSNEVSRRGNNLLDKLKRLFRSTTRRPNPTFVPPDTTANFLANKNAVTHLQQMFALQRRHNVIHLLFFVCKYSLLHLGCFWNVLNGTNGYSYWFFYFDFVSNIFSYTITVFLIVFQGYTVYPHIL